MIEDIERCLGMNPQLGKGVPIRRKVQKTLN